jgi:hypothetical protein
MGVDIKGTKKLLTLRGLPMLMGKHPAIDDYIKTRFEKGK